MTVAEVARHHGGTARAAVRWIAGGRLHGAAPGKTGGATGDTDGSGG